jgi:hypothetical protein
MRHIDMSAQSKYDEKQLRNPLNSQMTELGPKTRLVFSTAEVLRDMLPETSF